MSYVYDVGEKLLEDFEDGFDCVPSAGAATHVHDHSETKFPDIITGKRKEKYSLLIN